MKKDIETREDIELLVNNFYEKVKRDDLIGFIFTDVRKVNWDKHLPVMYRFWENVLFFSGGYTGNPLEMHKKLHGHIFLKKEYFQRWIDLFNDTADELFEGPNSVNIKQRAFGISAIMQTKIFQKDDPGGI